MMKHTNTTFNGCKATSQQLKEFSLTMIVIGLVIGLGIFRTARDVAGAALTPELFFAAWIVGGIIALCGALTFAEIGSRLPVTGGYYAVFALAYHPVIAFSINCVLLISNAAALAGVALIGSEYIFQSSPFIAAVSILFFYFVNLAGLRQSARVQSGLMIIKVAVLVGIIATIFFIPAPQPELAISLNRAPYAGWMAVVLSFGLALKATCFSYGGYQQGINFGGEVYRPVRTIPRAVIVGMMLVILLYLMVNFAYYYIIGFEELKTADAIVTIVAGKMFGKTGELISSIVMFLAVLAYVNVSLLSNPRVMVAMSKDGILPAVMSKRHQPTGVFRVALTVFVMIAVAAVFFAGTFSAILSFTIFLDAMGMAGAGIALFILRKRQGSNNQGYTIKWFPLIPLVFILGYVFVAAVIAVTEPMYALTGTAAVIIFIVCYTFMNQNRFRNG